MVAFMLLTQVCGHALSLFGTSGNGLSRLNRTNSLAIPSLLWLVVREVRVMQANTVVRLCVQVCPFVHVCVCMHVFMCTSVCV